MATETPMAAYNSDPLLQKRDAALRVIDRFVESLATAEHADQVRALVGQTVPHLARMQAGHPRHLAKSLSKLANGLRRAGYVDQALAVLEWARDRQLLDQYLVDDFVRCYQATHDLEALEALAHRALRSGLDSAYALSTLAHAHARAGNEDAARRFCTLAVDVGFGSDVTFTMLIDTCGWRDDALATWLFDVARARGVAGRGTYTAMAAIYARAGSIEAAELVCAEARHRALLSPRLCTIMIGAYARLHRRTDAERVFNEATAAACVDARVYAACIEADLHCGDLKAARAHLRDAIEAGLADERCFSRVIQACLRAGYLRAAGRLSRQNGYLGSSARTRSIGSASALPLRDRTLVARKSEL